MIKSKIDFSSVIFNQIVEQYTPTLSDDLKKELEEYFFNDKQDHEKTFNSYFLKNTIEFYDISFNVLTDDIKKILSKLNSITFNNSDFFIRGLGFTSKKLYYHKCKFKADYHIINNSDIQENRNYLYYNCEFFCDVSFSPDSREIDIHLFRDCKFNGSIYSDKRVFRKQVFINSEQNPYKFINEINFQNCTFEESFIIHNPNRDNDKNFFKINHLNFMNSQFKRDAKVKIQFCEIKKANFYNTKFSDLADFYQTKFTDEVNFERTDFERISVFSEAIFDCDVDFKYTKFLSKSIFRDTVITKNHKLNLRDTIFNDEANFLDITSVKRKQNAEKQFIGEPEDIKVANRETARIIKNFYDNSNNIIEANKFYALEMKEREKELKWHKEPLDWLVFKVHGLASNHSQDWTLALFWIINLTFFYSFLKVNIDENFILSSSLKVLFSFIAILVIGCITIKIPESNEKRWLTTVPTTIVCYVFYGYLVENDWSLSKYSKNLNPFSIMRGDEPITFGTLIFKIIIAYLIYQLIISIRQNTRRK